MTTHDKVLVALDIETTGLDPSSDGIVEMAAVQFTSSGEILDTYETLTNPSILIPPEAWELHHISNKMIINEPEPLSAWNALLDWVDSTLFVVHRAPFEVSFIRRLQSDHPKMEQLQFIDTLEIHKELYPDAKYRRLGALIPRRNLHRALPDAKAAVELFVQLREAYESKEIPAKYIQPIQDIEDIGEASSTSHQVSRSESSSFSETMSAVSQTTKSTKKYLVWVAIYFILVLILMVR